MLVIPYDIIKINTVFDIKSRNREKKCPELYEISTTFCPRKFNPNYSYYKSQDQVVRFKLVGRDKAEMHDDNNATQIVTVNAPLTIAIIQTR